MAIAISPPPEQPPRRRHRQRLIQVVPRFTYLFLIISGALLLKQDKFPRVSDLDWETGFGLSAVWTTPQPIYDPDQKCPFRDSPLFRSVYVYPNPGEKEWQGDILSDHGPNITSWPWLEMDKYTRAAGIFHYDPLSEGVQYTTELLVREILTNPNSCLATTDPEKAKLFYVPYLPSVEFHNGSLYGRSYDTSLYGQAIIDAVDTGNYSAWETTFGLTSRYWKRRGGADHILVFSEPLHGLWHPRWRRGSYHYVYSQKQLTPPIVVSVELSRTFVDKYPHCARKNILVPYPNTDGKWFNGKYDQQALELYEKHQITVNGSLSALPAERKLYLQQQQLQQQQLSNASSSQQPYPRPLAQFYRGGDHGTCTRLRKVLNANFQCTESSKILRVEGEKQKQQNEIPLLDDFTMAYRQSTFCPCPGGDSPSAKRMFDALHAGCIPLILSWDFVWPYSAEYDWMNALGTGSGTTHDKGVDSSGTSSGGSGSSSDMINYSTLLRPDDFSIRLQAKKYDDESFDRNCQPLQMNSSSTSSTTTNTGLAAETIQHFIEQIPAAELQRLRQGVQVAADRYAYYQRRPDLPDNPLQAGTLPDGGAAHALVHALAERANGVRWPACQQELEDYAAAYAAAKREPDGEASEFYC